MATVKIRRRKRGRWTVGSLIIYKRKNYWQYYHRPPKGEKSRGTLGTKVFETAVARALELDAKLASGMALPEKGPRLIELVREFHASYSGWSEETHRRNTYYGRVLVQEFGNRPINQLKPIEIEAWLKRRSTKGAYQRKKGGQVFTASPSTRNRYISFVRKLYAVAVDWGWIEHNPMLGLKHVREHQKIPEALTSAQLERLLSHLTEPSKTIVAIASDTGIRRGALHALTWDAVDFSRQVIKVQQTKGKKERFVPMTSRVMTLIGQLLAENRASKKPRLTVLPNYEIKKPLAKAAEAAGLGHIHFHMFRHTCATRLLESGADIRYVQEILGHASIEMTARYAHVRVEKLHEVFRGLEAHEGGQ